MGDKGEQLVINYIDDEEFDENQNTKTDSKEGIVDDPLNSKKLIVRLEKTDLKAKMTSSKRKRTTRQPRAPAETKKSSKKSNKKSSKKTKKQTESAPIKVEDDVEHSSSHSLKNGRESGIKYEETGQIHEEFKEEPEDSFNKKFGMRGPIGGEAFLKALENFKQKTENDDFFKVVDLDAPKFKIKGGPQMFKCAHCLYVGNSKANLDRHKILHLSPDEIIWYQCTECSYKSKYEHQLKSHYLVHKNKDDIVYFQCPHCEIKCSRKHNLNNHIKSIHTDRIYSFSCAECSYSTFSKERLAAHVKRHSKQLYRCDKCTFMTKRQEYLKTHNSMVHAVDNPRRFPCDTCSYKAKNQRELHRHYDRMHNKDKLHVYQCNHCSFNSIYKKNLEFHLLHMHQNSEGFQKFICGHCQKDFLYKNGLKVHIIRCHIKFSEADLHKCLECNYKSKDVNTLKRHIKRTHGAPRLHCEQCSFATNRQKSMDAHLRTHEIDNTDILKCPECPYRIAKVTSFLYHMRVIHGKQMTGTEAAKFYFKEE